MKYILAACLVLVGSSWPRPATARSVVEFETGAAINGYNDVRIPGDLGTEFSLSEDLDNDAVLYFRARLSYQFGERNHISALVAPLRFDSEGTLDENLTFLDQSFASGTPLKGRYRFDSYRLSYRYDILKRETVTFGLGVTGKIRDAEISISGDGRLVAKKNTGFVPLINFSLDWRFSEPVGLLVAGDALAAPQGRAEDVLLALYGNLLRNVDLRLGYRILEGGADNDEVYNFALVHYLAVGLAVRF